MPGIVGIFSPDQPDLCRAQLRSMLSALPSGLSCQSGTYEDASAGVYVGWKCHQGAFDDGLPIANETGKKLLFLRGEVFHDHGDIRRLESSGHRVDGRKAAFLIHLYEECGLGILEKLNGWFSGLIIDLEAGSCHLFNDRYGMRRLFINEDGPRFFFSSHAGALMPVLPESRAFEPGGLAEYITCGCPLGDHTLFKNISILPAGSVWTIRGRSIVQRASYFDRRVWENQPRLPDEDYFDHVLDILPGIIRKYGEASTPVGISLTGGLDTRIVVACLEGDLSRFPSYTFGGLYRDTFDVKLARKVAAACGLEHTTVVLGREFLRDFPEYLEEGVVRSDGCLGFPAAAALYVNIAAKGISPIRLTANYASELFRGVRAFKPRRPAIPFYDPSFGSRIEEAFHAFRRLQALDPLSFSLFVQAPSLGYGLLSVEESELTIRTPFMDNALVELVYRGARSYETGVRLSISAIRRSRPELLSIPTDFGFLGGGSPLARTVRRGVYLALFKGEYWSSHGMPQWVAGWARSLPAMSPERFFLGRHKYQHFRKWTSGELSRYLREFASSRGSLPSFFDRNTINAMIDDHVMGRRNYLDEIDKIMTIALVEKLFFRPDARQE